MLKTYLKKILKVARQGDAREESYYSTLKDLLNDHAVSTDKKNIHVTVNPKKTEAGNPDFRVWDGTQRIVGYIEAKTPDKNLEDIEKTEQIDRYRTTFPNLILTNFFDFWLFKNGVIVKKIRIADPLVIHSLKGIPYQENSEQFENLLAEFFIFSFPKITSAKPLAIELAKRTRFLRDEVIAEELREEENNGGGRILGFYEAFQTYLIRGLTKEEFADLYSQTITYGLFASRMRCTGEFTRKHAVDDIPRSIGILREMFDYISLGDLSSQLEWIVDEISNVLTNVDVEKIFSEYYDNKKGKDPVIHFYETFLAQYDPKKREQRGVYYTPKPVVSYIVRSLDLILKEKFGLEDGLAEENITILDPAAGTLTFIVEAINQAVNEFTSKYGEGGKESFIKEHILKNLYAFELMIAPYTIGHLKASFLLHELGYEQKNERVKFYLTNTLELEDIEQTSLPGTASLAEESRKAGKVKKQIPILVIMGNPPYSGISANMGKWVTDLIEDYKYVDGKHFRERKHWLQDDYVKFIRFAEWKINKSGEGVIGYITSHSYLDNPTFRGMRQHLMKSFNEIYILDLYGGGSSDRRVDSTKEDENVFDITTGVSISFFIKKQSQSDYNVHFSEIWETKENKFDWLLSHDITTTKWEELKPHSPFYLFIPIGEEIARKYEKFIKLTDIFPVNSVGVVTARDRFVIDFDTKPLIDRIRMFRNLSIPDNVMMENFGLKDTSSFNLTQAREELARDRNWDNHITKILYRPFDVRNIYYSNIVLERPLYKTMRHMRHDNLALISARSNKSTEMNHFYCSQYMTETKCGERTTQSYIFPLYLFPDNREKVANISSHIINLLENNYEASITPEQLLFYIYGIFYSNTYRSKYVDNLRIDFPRVPFPKCYDLFIKMGMKGKQLIELHLMRDITLDKPIVKFQGKGENIIIKPNYDEQSLRVYINETQYFEDVVSDVWNYRIGGYQVLSKWLKYRKGRKLSTAEIKHFCKVATSLQNTIAIQKEIDKVYPAIEKDIIKYKEKKENASLDEY